MFRRRSSGSPRRGSVPPILLGYAGLAGFLALEATTRRPGEASRLDETRTDDGTTRRIIRAYTVAAAAPAARIVPAPRLPRVAAVVGLALQVGGLGLRAWSMRSLGEAYSRTLKTGEA